MGISDTISMRESLNQSGFFNSPVPALDLQSFPSVNSNLATERAPIMRSAFQDDFETLEHSIAEPIQVPVMCKQPEPEFICGRPAEVLEMAPIVEEIK